jgi:hypothetical protein
MHDHELCSLHFAAAEYLGGCTCGRLTADLVSAAQAACSDCTCMLFCAKEMCQVASLHGVWCVGEQQLPCKDQQPCGPLIHPVGKHSLTAPTAQQPAHSTGTKGKRDNVLWAQSPKVEAQLLSCAICLLGLRHTLCTGLWLVMYGAADSLNTDSALTRRVSVLLAQ